jgi:hypothetical protein
MAQIQLPGVHLSRNRIYARWRVQSETILHGRDAKYVTMRFRPIVKWQISFLLNIFKKSRGSSVSIGTDSRLDGIRGSDSRRGMGIFFLWTTFRPAPEPTQPPIQWVSGELTPGVKWPGVKLTTHLLLVPRSRMRGAIPPPPNTSSWRGGYFSKGTILPLLLLNIFNIPVQLVLNYCPRNTYVWASPYHLRWVDGWWVGGWMDGRQTDI